MKFKDAFEDIIVLQESLTKYIFGKPSISTSNETILEMYNEQEVTLKLGRDMSSFLTKPSLTQNSQEPNLTSFWQPGGVQTSCQRKKGLRGIYRRGVLPTLLKKQRTSANPSVRSILFTQWIKGCSVHPDINQEFF